MVSYTNDKQGDDKQMRSHHPKSPSRYPAWAECPCWESDGATSQAASAGTAVHEQAQRYIESGEEPNDKTARWFGDSVIALAGTVEGIECEIKFIGLHGMLSGVFGYVDATFIKDGVRHIVDFKTFSDGSKNYRPQLEGYAAMLLDSSASNRDERVVLHILHGGIWRDESWMTSVGECFDGTIALLKTAEQNNKPNLCGWCTWCKKAKECPMVANAVQVVNDNGVAFNRLSLCQKLVVLDAVDKLSKTLRAEAKRMAEEAGGAIEMDGIRYELKPWAGPSKCTDICAMAGELASPSIMRMDDKKCEASEIPLVGISNEELLGLCDIPKTKVADLLKKKNADNKSVKKVEIDRLVEQFYQKTEGAPHFVRVR